MSVQDDKNLDLLKRVVQRWDELESRECTRHDFACLVCDIENHLAKGQISETP